MVDQKITAAHIQRFLIEYMEAAGLSVSGLAKQIEESTPGALSISVAALEGFLRGADHPSDSFLNICARFAAQVKIGRAE
jgi:hypothetical protein